MNFAKTPLFTEHLRTTASGIFSFIQLTRATVVLKACSHSVHSVCVRCMRDVFLLSESKKKLWCSFRLFWVWLLKFIKKRLQHRCFFVINTKFLKTPILKNICEWLLSKIYPVILFWFLEDISEQTVSWPSIIEHKIGALKTSAKFLGKYICCSFFTTKLQTFSLKFS